MEIYELIYNEKNKVYDERLLEPIREQRIARIEKPLFKYPWKFIPLPEYVTNIDESNSAKSKTKKYIEKSCLVKVAKKIFNFVSRIGIASFIFNYLNRRKEALESFKLKRKIKVAYELNSQIYYNYEEIIRDLKRIYYNKKYDEKEKVRFYNSFWYSYNVSYNSMIRTYKLDLEIIDLED